MEYGNQERFWALEVPLVCSPASTSTSTSTVGRTPQRLNKMEWARDPHLSLGYKLNDTFTAMEVAAAVRAVKAMRAAAPTWVAVASNCVMVDCSRPIDEWEKQIL